MILIVCLDDNGGMAFNRRRQSKDSAVRRRILELTRGKRLLMTPYSKKQFEEENGIIADENFLENAQTEDYCFAEVSSLSAFEKDAEKIIAYRWNRVYPADVKLDIDLQNGWEMVSSTDFEGSSHEKITEEVYER